MGDVVIVLPVVVLDGVPWATALLECPRCAHEFVTVHPAGTPGVACPRCAARIDFGWVEQAEPLMDPAEN